MGKVLSLRGVVVVIMAAISLLGAGSEAAAQAIQLSATGIHTLNGYPQSITLGPDGAIWYTELGANRIARYVLGTQALVNDFPLPTAAAFSSSIAPSGIVSGPDGALWFTEPGSNKIGRITASDPAAISEYPLSNISGPIGIAAGPDGALWFTEFNANKIGRITTGASPVVTEFAIPTPASGPQGIALGPDGALWFTESGANKIGRITVGASPTITEYPVPTSNSRPFVITAGPDGAMWFTELFGNNIGRISVGPSPAITETAVPTADAQPQGIATGTDGMLYFAESNAAKIGRIVPGASPTISENLTHQTGIPLGITSGPDGTLYFAEPGNLIGIVLLPSSYISVSFLGDGLGLVTSNSAAAQGYMGIQCDGSGVACAASFPTGKVVTLTASATPGSIFIGWGSLYPNMPCQGTDPCKIAAGDAAYITATFRRSTTNEFVSVTNAGNGTGTVTSSPSGIACGPTCNANFDRTMPIDLTAIAAAGSTFVGWSGGGCAGVGTCTVAPAAAATVTANYVLNTTSDVVLVSALLPTSRAIHTGATATVFATMINASADTAATNCTVAPNLSLPLTFMFQTTDPSTNALTGIPNTPVTIPPGGSQSFVLALTSVPRLLGNAPLPPIVFGSTDIPFYFTCTNATAAASVSGLNTLLLSASMLPTPDVIALAATPTSDGIVDIPGSSGTGAFAVATANVGDAGTVTASASGGGSNMPLATTICETNPATAQCLAPPAAQVQVTMAAGATPTFSVFVKGAGVVPFQPAANRIYVFFNGARDRVGSTSVAVRTQ